VSLLGSFPSVSSIKAFQGLACLPPILVDNYMDHLPLYRQRQRFLRENIPIAASTLEGWKKHSLEKLEILFFNCFKIALIMIVSFNQEKLKNHFILSFRKELIVIL
jgi:CMP-2-keto-3-deoxyoctulosonic acid synthetase